MVTTYEDSQSLIKGQKQHSKEIAIVTHYPIKPGFTRLQTLYCEKYRLLCLQNDWGLTEGARRLKVTPTECLDIWLCNIPFEQKHQDALYLTSGIKISTVRVLPEAAILKRARGYKFYEVFDNFKYVIQPLKSRGNGLIYVPGSSLNFIIGRVTSPNLGICLKAWRAGFNQTQYSIPERIQLVCPAMKEECSRDCWKNVEYNNIVTEKANRAFYRVTGYTVDQVVAPFEAFLNSKHINIYDPVQVYNTLDAIDPGVLATLS